LERYGGVHHMVLKDGVTRVVLEFFNQGKLRRTLSDG